VMQPRTRSPEIPLTLSPVLSYSLLLFSFLFLVLFLFFLFLCDTTVNQKEKLGFIVNGANVSRAYQRFGAHLCSVPSTCTQIGRKEHINAVDMYEGIGF
jgi:hypothetical protein